MLRKCLVVKGVELYLADYYHIHLKSLGRKLGPVLRRKCFINAREDSLARGKFLYKQILALVFFFFFLLRFLISLHSIPDATETAGQTYFFVDITTYYYYFFLFFTQKHPMDSVFSQCHRGTHRITEEEG